MAFLRSVTTPETGPVVYGDGVVLRPPQMTDYPAWAELRALSREFLTPWEPAWTSNELTRASFRRRLRHYAKELREDLGYAFFLLRSEDESLLGGLTLSNVRRGVTQACTLGYWVGAPYARQGCMSAAVKATVPFVFDTLRLHRLEAACLPHNTASVRLLERCGFQREGLARRYLRINGVWQDHLLFALLDDDPRL
ncbi:MAG: GNAT family N-acetyltransferase [Hyphomicrobiales bacterium]|nr:GNAT family N-acetyltransferase [Hyphomicrobiales bacterium]